MKIYDISQEVFGCRVYPGDPAPQRTVLSSIDGGDSYNLTAFSMCAHNGTHIDAPLHFLQRGKAIDDMELCTFVGPSYVAEHHGKLGARDAGEIVERAKTQDASAAARILIKGDAELTEDGAEVFARAGLLLIGTESESFGPVQAPMAVHLILLGAGIALLEGIRLGAVCEGTYLLCAAPLNLSGAEGSPCRAILIDE